MCILSKDTFTRAQRGVFTWTRWGYSRYDAGQGTLQHHHKLSNNIIDYIEDYQPLLNYIKLHHGINFLHEMIKHINICYPMKLSNGTSPHVLQGFPCHFCTKALCDRIESAVHLYTSERKVMQNCGLKCDDISMKYLWNIHEISMNELNLCKKRLLNYAWPS